MTDEELRLEAIKLVYSKLEANYSYPKGYAKELAEEIVAYVKGKAE